jgi:hypothetical protein
MMVQPLADALVIALTYGEDVDWYRNVKASGRARLLWHGKMYRLDKPEPPEAQESLQSYPAPEKWMLGKLGVRHFIRMRCRQETAPEGRS